ncbi:hypothetical protein BD779DRAFT_1552738 [Infundibulicybe gibba]|nr:hypothetical protein BD779DRAFT_1552738 [Infundibulicybe gibba]
MNRWPSGWHKQQQTSLLVKRTWAPSTAITFPPIQPPDVSKETGHQIQRRAFRRQSSESWSRKRKSPTWMPSVLRISNLKVDLSEYEELSLGAFTDRIREVIPAKGLFPTLKVHDIFPSGSPQSDSNLHIVAVCSESLCSLSAATARKILVDMNEAEENDEASDDDSTVFDADDIRTAVAKMGYRIDFPLFGHPLVAMVSSVTDDSIGFIKFAPDGRKETQILQYLLGIDSPRNHTIAGARVWPVHGGQTGVAGVCLQNIPLIRIQACVQIYL